MEQITIAGHAFNVPVRYEEGHELTAGEASALNQTYHENLRNNFAKKVKEATEAGNADLAALQAELDQYAESYAFGIRSGGGGATRDPVMAEAMRIAKKQIGDAIRTKGGKVSDYTNEAITNAAKGLLARPDIGEKIMQVARDRVEEQKSLASSGLEDLLSGMTTKPAEAPATGGEGQTPTEGQPAQAAE